MSKLHVFDMDGTLLQGSACLEVSRHMGNLEAINVIEEAWGRGEVGHVEFYELCLPLWEGLTAADIDQVFAATPWLAGVEEVLNDIARRGERSAVVSLSPQFFVDRLLGWGATSVHGAEVVAGQELEPALVLTPESKPMLVRELMDRYRVGEADCVAYGDSASDIPLFEMLTNTVSVNGSTRLQGLAARHYEGADLRGAYAEGRGLLDGAPCRATKLTELTG